MHMRLPALEFMPLMRAVKRQIKAFGQLPRSYRADPEVAGEIARDLSLTVSELYSLAAQKSGKPGQLLDKRLESAGLHKEKLAKVHPDVLRDLQRVCGGCASTATCARDFERANGEAEIPNYCPNEQTLQALVQEENRKQG